MPDLRSLVVLLIVVAIALAVVAGRRHLAPRHTPLRYGLCDWCRSEDHAGPACSRRHDPDATQVLAVIVPAQPEAGPLSHLFDFARSHSK